MDNPHVHVEISRSARILTTIAKRLALLAVLTDDILGDSQVVGIIEVDDRYVEV